MELAIWYKPVPLCELKRPQVREWDCHSMQRTWERAGQQVVTPVTRSTSITNGPPNPLERPRTLSGKRGYHTAKNQNLCRQLKDDHQKPKLG